MKRGSLALAVVLLGLWSCSECAMKRELPFQEIVPLNGGIAVINGGLWYNDALAVTLIGSGGSSIPRRYGADGVCVFDGLENGRTYTIDIGRTDLKGRLLYQHLRRSVSPRSGGSAYIVLVGASVGKAWEFPKLLERRSVSRGDLVLGSRTVYAFDKGPEIRRLVDLPVQVTAVIIKECAAYFPRDIGEGLSLIQDWVALLREKDIVPVVATVLPVTLKHDASHPGRFGSIVGFNDAIRRYAEAEGLEVLDLEAAACISEADRHLREEYAQEDGLHLVRRAYEEVLDEAGGELIDKLKGRPQNAGERVTSSGEIRRRSIIGGGE